MKCENCSRLNGKRNFQIRKCPLCDKKPTIAHSKPSVKSIVNKKTTTTTTTTVSKTDLEESLNEVTSIKTKLDENRELKLKLGLDRLSLLRDEINSKAKEIITAIQKKQMKLLTETKNIELHLRKKYMLSAFDSDLDAKTTEAKFILSRTGLPDYVIESLMDELLKIKPELTERLFLFEKCLDDDYEFVSKLSAETELCEFGEIISKKEVSTQNRRRRKDSTYNNVSFIMSYFRISYSSLFSS